MLMQSLGQVRRVYGKRNGDCGTQETPMASEPGLRETGEKSVDRTRTREGLVLG